MDQLCDYWFTTGVTSEPGAGGRERPEGLGETEGGRRAPGRGAQEQARGWGQLGRGGARGERLLCSQTDLGAGRTLTYEVRVDPSPWFPLRLKGNHLAEMLPSARALRRLMTVQGFDSVLETVGDSGATAGRS